MRCITVKASNTKDVHALLRIAYDVAERNSAGILEDFVFLSRPSPFAYPAATEIVRSFFRRMRKTQIVMLNRIGRLKAEVALKRIIKI